MNDISVYLDRQRGGKGSLIERTHFTHMFSVLNKKQYVLASGAFKAPVFGTETARKGFKIRDPFSLPLST